VKRLFAIAVCSAAIAGGVPAGACANSAVASAIAKLLDEVCVSAANAEEIISSAEKLGQRPGWKVLAARPAPMSMMHNENGPNVSYAIVVEGQPIDDVTIQLFASILRPEIPGMIYNICSVEPSKQVEEMDLRNAIDGRFAARFERTSFNRKTDYDQWVIPTEETSGRCERKLTVLHWQMSSRGKPRTMTYTHFALPSGDKSPMAQFMMNCKMH
jgi:hypothetical protein